MKSMLEINEKKVPAVRIDPSLDKYDNVVHFQDKLAKANEQIKKSGFPKLTEKNTAANIAFAKYVLTATLHLHSFECKSLLLTFVGTSNSIASW